MALKEIAVDGCTLSKTEASIVTPASTTCFINNKGIYKGDLTISVTGSRGDNGQVVNGDGVGTGTLKPTASDVFVDGDKVIRKGDKITISINGTKPSSSGSVPASDTVEVEITDAGQSEVKAE